MSEKQYPPDKEKKRQRRLRLLLLFVLFLLIVGLIFAWLVSLPPPPPDDGSCADADTLRTPTAGPTCTPTVGPTASDTTQPASVTSTVSATPTATDTATDTPTATDTDTPIATTEPPTDTTEPPIDTANAPIATPQRPTLTPTAGAPPISPGPGGGVCTRFNFQQGRDGETGSRGAGLYEMKETTGRFITSWQAQDGQTDSDWITGLGISFPSVHVEVTFHPANGAAPIQMEIVNPAPGSTAGWVTRGICHAVEIQYPEGVTLAPPPVLPVTGLSPFAAIGQVLGVVLLAVALMFIAAGLWPLEDDDR